MENDFFSQSNPYFINKNSSCLFNRSNKVNNAFNNKLFAQPVKKDSFPIKIKNPPFYNSGFSQYNTHHYQHNNSNYNTNTNMSNLNSYNPIMGIGGSLGGFGQHSFSMEPWQFHQMQKMKGIINSTNFLNIPSNSNTNILNSNKKANIKSNLGSINVNDNLQKEMTLKEKNNDYIFNKYNKDYNQYINRNFDQINEVKDLNRSLSEIRGFNTINFQSEELYILENVDKLLKDQKGCRILQKKLEEMNTDFLNRFYDKIKFKVSEVINNQFGNFVIQKFLECCLCVEYNLLGSFINDIKTNFLIHSIDPYGSRAIQKLLELLTNSYSKIFLNKNNTNKIDFNAKETIKQNLFIKNNSQANLKTFNYAGSFPNNYYSTNQINNSFSNRISKNENDQYALTNSEVSISSFTAEKVNIEVKTLNITDVISEIIETFSEFCKHNIFNLIGDTNGNHVLQKIYLLSRKHNLMNLHEELLKNISEISKLKQGASVINRMIEISNDSLKKAIGIEFLKSLEKLINDEYANYVVQMIVSMKFTEINDQIFSYISNNMLELCKKKYSSNVIDKVKF